MSRRVTTALAYTLLTTAAVVSFLLPDGLSTPSASAQATPPEYTIHGVVRDFLSAHSDFDVLPAIGFGHVAGNVSASLDAEERPVYLPGSPGDGGVVNDYDLVAGWKFDEGSGLTVYDAMGLNPGTIINGASWTTGQENTGLHFDGVDDYIEIPSSPQMQITGDITFTAWFKLDENFNSSSPETLVIMEKFLDTEHDFHIALAGLDYNRPEVPKGTLVFKVENGPTSDYYCYTWTQRDSWGAGEWHHFSAVLKSGDTSQNEIIIDGEVNTGSNIAAGVGFLDTDYDAPMRIGGRTIDYMGMATDIYFKGVIDEVKIYNRIITVDDYTYPQPVGQEVTTEWSDAAGEAISPQMFGVSGTACLAISDTPGGFGSYSGEAITSTDTFREWFRDVLGVNLAKIHSISLVRNADGVYEYLNSGFYPIDGMLLGNEGTARNDYFTYAIETDFTYNACLGQFIEFQGGDGAWMFIDDRLVVDLGGVSPSDAQRVELDRLGLADGETYSMHLFYAHRNAFSAVFRLRTNLDLSTQSLPPVTAMFD